MIQLEAEAESAPASVDAPDTGASVSAREQMGWLLAKAAISPRQAPAHLFTAARIFFVYMRARRQFVHSLRKRREQRIFSGLLGIEPQVSAHLSIPELRQLADLARHENPTALIGELLNSPSTQRSLPLAVRAKLIRFNEYLLANDGRFMDPPPRNKAAPAIKSHTVAMAFHSAAPLVVNGYAARSEEMIAAAEAAGWEPKPVLRLGYPHELQRFRNEPDIDTETINGREWKRLPDHRKGLLTRGLNDYVETYGKRLAEFATRNDARIIHAASNYVNGLAASYAARLAGNKCIYEVRGLWHVTKAAAGHDMENDVFYQGDDAFEVEAVRRADATICISGPVRDYLAERGARPESMSVIPNAVCARRYAPVPRNLSLAREWGLDPDRITIGYFGSFTPYEGLETLVSALETVIHDGIKVQALLVGEGPMKDEISRRIARARLSGLVRLGSRVPREEIVQLYSLVDIAPIARHDRPVTRLVPPIKLIEAMSCGVCPIVSGLAPLKEIVEHERNGLVVPAGDADALAAAVKRLSAEADLRQQLAAAARRDVEQRYSREIVSKGLNAVYAKVLAQ